MANTQGIGGAFKQDCLGAGIDGASLKAALFLASATRGPTDAVYNNTGEVTGTNYTEGGVVVTNGNTARLTSTTTFWTPSASIVYSNVTLGTAFDAVMIYNTSGNVNVGVFTFGSPE